MKRRAVCVGIDHYQLMPTLGGCAADAAAMRRLLKAHHDGARNFDAELITSGGEPVTRAVLRRAARTLFERTETEIALFYFAGHGLRSRYGSLLCTEEGGRDDEGVWMSEIVGYANSSPAREKIIVLDCCNGGAIDDVFASDHRLPLGKGVAILSASSESERAQEVNGRGLFTSRVCDALEGGGADVMGEVTAASVYAYVDQMLDGTGQRPQFLANLATLAPLRNAGSPVSDADLLALADLFPTDEHRLPLDPGYEPTQGYGDEAKERSFALLQKLRAARLVEPNGSSHMYWAALQGLTCSLTPLGRFHRRRALARAGRSG